jgi:hypothetical protein
MSKNKLKNKKKNVTVNKSTLDIKHREKLESFKKEIEKIPEKKKLLEKYTKELNIIDRKDPNAYTNNDIHKRAFIKDAINKLENEINSTVNGRNEMEYFMNCIDILPLYYSKTDEDDSDSDYENYSEDDMDDSSNILSFFNTVNTKTNQKNKNAPKSNSENSGDFVEYGEDEDTNSVSNTQSGEIQKKKLSKVKLYEKYLEIVDKKYNGKKIFNQIEKCHKCNRERVIDQVDGCLVCEQCGDKDMILTETDKPNYKDPTPDNNTYAYKRKNHLNEILSQIQAQESTEIPRNVYDSIMEEINKRRIKKDQIDIEKMRKILKRLNLRKFYEHVPHIIYKINQIPPPTFSRTTIEQFRKMFDEMQEPFALYKPAYRKNFLNYFYVLHKCCQILELDDYLKFFPLLKNTKKLKEQEAIWEKICKYLDWEFIPSI